MTPKNEKNSSLRKSRFREILKTAEGSKKRWKKSNAVEREDWGRKHNSESIRWMLFAGLGVMALVVFVIFKSQKPRQETLSEPEKSIFIKIGSVEGGENQESEEIQLLTVGLDKASKMYALFLKAKTPEDICKLIYGSKEVMPLVEANWKAAEGIPEDWIPTKEVLWKVLDKDEQQYAVLDCLGPDFLPGAAYFRLEEGSLKIDWKATTGYGTASFEELSSGKGDGREIRGSISNSNFYTAMFPEDRFQCYRLTSPDRFSSIWTYVEIGGEAHKKLLSKLSNKIFDDAKNQLQVLISLDPGPEKSLPNQWLLKGNVQLTWISQ